MSSFISQALRSAIVVGAVSAAILFASCGGSGSPASDRPESVTFEPENFKKLSDGMPEHDVVELLGEPEAKTKNSFSGVDLIYSTDNRVFDVLIEGGKVATFGSASCERKLFTDPEASAFLGKKFIEACQ